MNILHNLMNVLYKLRGIIIKKLSIINDKFYYKICLHFVYLIKKLIINNNYQTVDNLMNTMCVSFTCLARV